MQNVLAELHLGFGLRRVNIGTLEVRAPTNFESKGIRSINLRLVLYELKSETIITQSPICSSREK